MVDWTGPPNFLNKSNVKNENFILKNSENLLRKGL